MEKEFDSVPVWRLVLHLGLPAMLAQLFNILYSMVDRIFVGHISGSGALALAGIGICAPALTGVTAFATLVGIGGAAILSISMGQRDREAAQRAMSTSLWMLAALSILVTAVLLACSRPLLYLLGCSDAIYPYAADYFRVYVLGTFAALIGGGMNQFILAQGMAKRGMISVLLGAVINTVLDPILIFGLHMGIRGAAIATVTAQVCTMLYVLGTLTGRKAELRLRLSRPELPVAGRITVIGSLPFLIILLDNVLVILLNTTLRRYGGEAGDQLISCGAVVQSFMVLAYYPAQGITSGCGTLFGYYYGARNLRKMMQTFRWVLVVCLGLMGLLLIGAQLGAGAFSRLFLEDRETAAMAAAAIRRYTAGLLGVGVQYAFVEGLTSMGKIRYALPISFFRKGLYVAAVLLLPLVLPAPQVFWAAAISDLAGAAVTLLLFFGRIAPGLKRELSEGENAPEAG